MRPLVWGIILTVIGAFLWVFFSVAFALVYGLAGYSFEELPIICKALIIIPGLFLIFSVPVSIIIEIILWIKRKLSD